MSTFAQLPAPVLARGIERLARDLADGTWDARYGTLRTRETDDVGYRLIVAGR